MVGKYYTRAYARSLGQYHNSISEILPNKLYLGNAKDAENFEELLRLGITHILNVTPNIPCYYPNTFKYQKIAHEDGTNGLAKHFQKAIEFISKGERVFVHCRMGQSRSPSMVMAYLMKQYDMNFDQALKEVKSKKPDVTPHWIFELELKQALEKEESTQQPRRSKRLQRLKSSN